MLTDAAALSTPLRGVHWVDCLGETERPTNRDGARNATEARMVVDWLAAHADAATSVGTVTPFAAQAELLHRLADDEFDHDTRERLHLSVGTVHTYQGAERDIMPFSPVSLPRSASRLLAQLADPLLVQSALDRLQSAAYELVIEGDSYRRRHKPSVTTNRKDH